MAMATAVAAPLAAAPVNKAPKQPPVSDSDFCQLAGVLTADDKAIVKKVRTYLETKVQPMIKKYIELERPGGEAAALVLSFSMRFALEKNGTLADDALVDIVEHSLARLGAIDAETSVQSQATWAAALDVLEQLRARLAREQISEVRLPLTAHPPGPDLHPPEVWYAS